MLREWLEKDGDSELYILQVLFARMGELNSGNASTYSEKLMQSKLKEKYRDHIYFTNLPGRPNIACLYETITKSWNHKRLSWSQFIIFFQLQKVSNFHVLFR